MMKYVNVLLVILFLCLTLLFADVVTKHGSLTLIHARATQTPTPVELKILQPVDGEVVSGPDATIKFQLKNWKPQQNGNHLHFLLDDNPYEDHYSAEPLVLHNVQPGAHVIRAFPVYPWHESVKQSEALSIVHFYVKEKSGEFPVDATQPTMIYNAPVGTHSAKDQLSGQPHPGILIDWFIHGLTMGSRTGYFVRISVDGTALVSMKEWRPHYLQNLSSGEHKIKLELLKNGVPVTTNWNSVEQTITVR